MGPTTSWLPATERTRKRLKKNSSGRDVNSKERATIRDSSNSRDTRNVNSSKNISTSRVDSSRRDNWNFRRCQQKQGCQIPLVEAPEAEEMLPSIETPARARRQQQQRQQLAQNS
jgi:hypothetical protein